MCFDNYITIDRSTPSRSGLYAVDLPGVSLSMLEELTSDEQEDYLELWQKIYSRAIARLVSDFTDRMMEKFLVDLKLATRETSEFLTEFNTGSDLAGVKIKFALPKYAKLHIISIGVYSEGNHTTPQAQIVFYDTDQDGEVLLQKSATITTGRNTINIDQDFSVDEIFIAYNPETYSFRKTQNKYFHSQGYPYDKLECTFPCSRFGSGTVTQVNGGGVNVKFVIQCSIEKLICENLNLFKYPLWWAIGVESMIERNMTEVMCRFTALSKENADANMAMYNTEFEKKLTSTVEGFRIPEDTDCFACKSPVTVSSFLP